MAVAQFIWEERTLVENHIGNFKNVGKRDDTEPLQDEIRTGHQVKFLFSRVTKFYLTTPSYS